MLALNLHQIYLERFPPFGGNPEGKGGQYHRNGGQHHRNINSVEQVQEVLEAIQGKTIEELKQNLSNALILVFDFNSEHY